MLDVCLESYGAIAHVVDSLFASGVFLRRGSGADTIVADDPATPSRLGVREQASELPLAQAKALWLVDVCGATYDQAAAETRTTRHELAGNIVAARQTIRYLSP